LLVSTCTRQHLDLAAFFPRDADDRGDHLFNGCVPFVENVRNDFGIAVDALERV
jgi:hypothetical protein